PELPLDNKLERPLHLLEQFTAEFKGRTLFVAETAGRREVLLEMLAHIPLKPEPVDSWAEFVTGEQPCAITIAPVAEGLLCNAPAIALIAASQLVGQPAEQRPRRGKAHDR